MSNKYTFEEVIKLADTEPDRKVWCISVDGTVDCLVKANEIKKAIEGDSNIDWRDVNFMKINNSNDNQEEHKDNKDMDNKFTFTKRKINHKIQMFRANNLSDLMTIVNQFLEGKEDIIKIDYQIGQSNTIGLLSMEYSVMVHYIES